MTIEGETRDYAGRFFCPRCGSSVFARTRGRDRGAPGLPRRARPAHADLRELDHPPRVLAAAVPARRGVRARSRGHGSFRGHPLETRRSRCSRFWNRDQRRRAPGKRRIESARPRGQASPAADALSTDLLSPPPGAVDRLGAALSSPLAAAWGAGARPSARSTGGLNRPHASRPLPPAGTDPATLRFEVRPFAMLVGALHCAAAPKTTMHHIGPVTFRGRPHRSSNKRQPRRRWTGDPSRSPGRRMSSISCPAIRIRDCRRGHCQGPS